MNPPPAQPPNHPDRSLPISGLRPQVSGFVSRISGFVCVAAVALTSLLFQFFPAWRSILLYDRAALAAGDWWRVWTGHLVHFGWPHFVVDAGLLVIVGWFAERRHPRFTRLALLLMPAAISASLFWLEPDMARYGGLSAVNLGLLLYVAVRGWGRDRGDWFWPAIVAAYIAELAFEYYRGGHGGGAIRFDDPGIRVATGAHLAATAYALVALAIGRIVGRDR